MPTNELSVYCPICHRYTAVGVARVWVNRATDHAVSAVWDDVRGNKWWIGVCNYCGDPMLVQNDGSKIYPHPLPKPTSNSIPPEIREDLDEAKSCCSVSAWRAAAVMARRAMQSAATKMGSNKNKLADQIADLATKGEITRQLKEWADAVRWVGNDAAHPGGQPVTQKEAEDVVSLAEQFLHTLYVTPAIADSLRTRIGK